MSTYILRKGVAGLDDLVDGSSAKGVPGAGYEGVDYFVNNITGSSGNDGSSWGNAMDQISTAITASDAAHTACASGNVYGRNRIFVQGTSTAYTNLSALPSYCDIIGIGADPRGNGAGIARVTSATSTDTIASAGVRGLNIYNMQFTGTAAPSTGYAMDLAIAYRCRFENCVFTNKSTAAVRVVKGGGLVFKDCIIGGGDTVTCAIGLHTSGTGGASNFNNCLIENCVIWGSANGLKIDTYSNNFTTVKSNYIYGATIGVDDNCASSNMQNNVMYIGNYVYSASDCFSIAQNDGKTAIGNYANQGGTSEWEDEIGT